MGLVMTAVAVLGGCTQDAELRVAIVNGNGERVQGARVEAVPQGDVRDWLPSSVEGVTDENGVVELKAPRTDLLVRAWDGRCTYWCYYGFTDGKPTPPLGINLLAEDGCENGRVLMAIFFP